jgi:FkbM family methyltransferase
VKQPRTVTVPIAGIEVLLLDEHDRVAWHQEHNPAGFEPESLAMWASLVSPECVALDVGAYTGLYAITAAKLGAIAYAFEPLPKTAARLRDNIALNNVDVTVLQVAASDKKLREATLWGGRSPLPSGTKIAQKSEKGIPLGTTPTVRLDAMTFGGRRVSVMKIDVERHEPRVLRGARGLLERDRPALLIEALGGDEALDIMAELPEFYRIRGQLDRRNLLVTA